jgi:hypothetical protein
MSRAQLTAVMTALAVGAFAPRLVAQDTSTTRETRPDTSGYNGTAGVDTTAQPGRVGALDSSGTALDSMRSGSDTMAAPGRADQDTTGPLGASDSSGMSGRHPNRTMPGDSTSPSDSGSMSDSGSVSQPTKQPGQGTSRTGDSSSTGP